MIKFVQVTYPFLLVWAAFTHRKMANLEESLSQADKNEHLFTDTEQKNNRSNREDLAKESENALHEDINHSDADADKEANISIEGNVSKKKYSSAKEPFNLATNQKQRKRNVNATDFNTKRTDLSHGRKLNNNNIKKNISYNTTTTCVLLNDLDSIDDTQYELNNSITTFDFTLDLMTDDYPYETSWKLLPQNTNDTVIDSRDENATSSELVGSTLHKFEYRCVVLSEETNEINNIQLENICYNFELHDSFGDGICCKSGLGYFSLSLNNSTTPIIADRLYLSSLISPFCLGNSNESSESKLDTSAQYPARECIDQPCICDSKPRLSNIKEDDEMFNTKLLTLNGIILMSDTKDLADYESPQYKAACWVLHDDAFFHKNSIKIEKRKERMMQRYLLALLYFTTTPEKWDNHYHFLSSKSECEWNDDDDTGIFCDEDNAFFISLAENNLEGTVIDEISELRTLEYLNLRNNNIHGAIPGALGRLSGLRVLNLGENKLEGTIPPQLFNLTNQEDLSIEKNRLEGTIHDTIGNLHKLSRLDMGLNNLSGSIPQSFYSLENLEVLVLNGNKLSSSISSLIGNLNKLKQLDLDNNRFTGQIPPTIGSLTSLKSLELSNNILSGEIPETLFDLHPGKLFLESNILTGTIPDQFCNTSSVEADCRNDVFGPEVSCNCCARCFDETPSWSGGCADATVKVVIDHKNYNSNDLEWSLTNNAIEKRVLFEGPYKTESRISTYEACISYSSDCFSLNMISPPWSNTNYTIYWNDESIYNGTFLGYKNNDDDGDDDVPLDSVLCPGLSSSDYCDCRGDCTNNPSWCSCIEAITCCDIYWNNNSIHNGTFLGYWDNDDINEDDQPQILLTFQYDSMNGEIEFDLTSCNKVQYICDVHDEPFDLQPNTTERAMFNYAIMISSTDTINDPASYQSRALCWLLQDHSSFNSMNDTFETKFTQKYVLTLLHLSSSYPIFGIDEYPPSSHECQWQGVMCSKVDSDIVTEISLENNQTIDGTLLQELGNLAFLEKLDLSQSEVNGTIPRVFSNLWSLKELNLSGNKIGGAIPATLFRQLNKLERINLSDNLLSGSVIKDIGSFSNIHFLSLSKNKLTGPLPLDKFKHRELEHLDIGENELSEIDFSILLEHTKLNFLDISSNFFVGSLLDHTFISLSQLQYLNISQNDFSGTIPTTFPELSNITHFDAHVNKLKGPIPLGIAELQSIQHLNLQGNKLTGSLPSELNQLKSLNTLALGHNELKGSIPFNQENLQNINRLHLQNNKLEGEAPQFSNMIYYITDCGFPSDSLDKVTCSSCNTCCNSEGGCQSKNSKELSQVGSTLVFMFTIVGFITACYALKDRITSNKYLESFFKEKVKSWNALMLISDKSVYHFLLIDNKTEWYVAVVCGIFQTATLFLFVRSADMMNETSDREYTMLCPANSLECDDLKKVSPYGIFVSGLILTIWLMRDIIGSVKLMLVSFEKRNIDFFFTSGVVFSVTMLSLWSSIIYIDAIAAKNTDMIKDAVVLLFVIEVDERIFQLVESVNPNWTDAIERNMRDSLVYEGKNLIISSWIDKNSEYFNSLSKMIRRRNEESSEVVGEDEDRVVRRDESNL